MFFYVMGQNAFIVWVPIYLADSFSLGLEEAGAAVSSYWGAGMVGLIISALVLQKIRTGAFLLVVTSTGALLTGILMCVESESNFTATAALLGLVTIGSMGSMISLGVHQQKYPSMSLVPFLLCCASSGGAVSPVASSFVVGFTGVEASITIIFSAYLATFLILSLVILGRPRDAESKLVYPRV